MALPLTACCWCGLAGALFVTSFGLGSGLWILVYAGTCLLGIVVMLFMFGAQRMDEWRKLGYRTATNPTNQGVNDLVVNVYKGKPKLKMDKRMTGSTVIDEVLQELLVYTYRDYIHLWYHRISDDDQFQYDIRQTLQRVVIAFSERAKDVDLVPYLTHQLVDDFASHIRLYRRTLAKMLEQKKDNTKPSAELESIFFDLELEMENNICRDQICQYEASERQFLQEVSEVLMFLLLPPGDFHNKLFRYIVRVCCDLLCDQEVLVNGVLLPTMNLLSDPDYINQTISWLCKETMLTSESLLTILRTSDSVEELEALGEKVDLDLARLRARDSGGDDDTVIKQQLSSLTLVKSVCEERIQQLRSGVEDTNCLILPGGLDVSKLLSPGQKLYSLPFDIVLNNNVSLSHFIEFMTSIDMQGYIFFYLTVEGYRASVEQQSAAMRAQNGRDAYDLDSLREAALAIYDQYFSEMACPRVKLDDLLLKSICHKIEKADVLQGVFDDAQAKVCEMLQEDPRFFAAFKQSPLYVKLLAELDLLQEVISVGPKAEDAQSYEEDGQSLASQTSSLREESPEDSCDSVSSSDGVVTASLPSTNSFTLSASITNTGLCREHGSSYTVYLVTVVKRSSDGGEHSWDVYRRYSDFDDFHAMLISKYPSLSGTLLLPKKRAFDNMNAEFLERRRVGLGVYLQSLLAPGLHALHTGLRDSAQQFLQHAHWERERSDLGRKMDILVKPLRSSVRSVSNMVRAVPDNIADGVARVSGGILNIPGNMVDGVGKMLNVRGNNFANVLAALLTTVTNQPPAIAPAIKVDVLESGKVGASLDTESDEDSIPLHIMLLLLDEVFELKSRNQWLRRQIVAILQQVAKTMFGDSINRKIVEHVAYLTSPEQIAEYMRSFRDSRWPNGALAEAQPARDTSTKMRTRVVCKAKLFGNLSEELEHLIGSETTRQGVTLVFNMLQHARLNRRLAYVVLEGLLDTIFPDNKLHDTFRKIHSTSPRVKKPDKPAR